MLDFRLLAYDRTFYNMVRDGSVGEEGTQLGDHHPVAGEENYFTLLSGLHIYTLLQSINVVNMYFYCFEPSSFETNARISVVKTGNFVGVRVFWKPVVELLGSEPLFCKDTH